MIKKTYFLLFVLYSAISCGQHQPPATAAYRQFLKRPAFKPISTELTESLRIPYLENGMYGICDYNGTVLVQPIFEAVKMPQPGIPVFCAKKNGLWAFYDYTGKQALPFSYSDSEILYDVVYYKKLKIDYTSNFIAQIPVFGKDAFSIPADQYSVDNNSSKLPNRFYYINEQTKKPYQQWRTMVYKKILLKNEKEMISYHEDYGFINVMDDNFNTVFLDQNGNKLIQSETACGILTESKAAVMNKEGMVALWDFKKDWKTDYMFSLLWPTPNPEICMGVNKESGNDQFFIIKGKNNIIKLKNRDDYEPIDQRYSIICDHAENGKKIYRLYDELKNRTVLESDSYLYKNTIFEPGISINIHKNGVKKKGIVTFEGDTIIEPPYKWFRTIGDSMYTFNTDSLWGFANRKNKVLYSMTKGEIGEIWQNYFFPHDTANVGMVTSSGQVIFPVEYNQIMPTPDGRRAIVVKNGLFGLYSIPDGKVMIPLQSAEMSLTYFLLEHTILYINDGNQKWTITEDLEILAEKSDDPIIKKSEFTLVNAPEPAIRDFERAQMPTEYGNYFLIQGPRWVHIFRCDGTYIQSIEGIKSSERLKTDYFKYRHVPFNTDIGKLTTVDDQIVYVRLRDGYLYRH